ncbi:MAG TPA: TetR family transcriptional regulator [Polyangiaceae bacterium]|nr:TetR family transcriptional regulator [Polyangiaceae bacterium]
MAKKAPRAPARRDAALSQERIVGAAIELLDEQGEEGLTFRALATRLATGSGAIYWHVTNKSELLVVATNAVVARTLSDRLPSSSPRKAIRDVAVCVFEIVDAHPWLGAQLWRAPSPTAMLQIFERIGRQVQALGVRGSAQFTSVSALVSYILGVSVQNAESRRTFEPSADRAEFLAKEATRWKELDPEEYSFTRSVATQLRKHDDRTEFLAGIDLILAGIGASK